MMIVNDENKLEHHSRVVNYAPRVFNHTHRIVNYAPKEHLKYWLQLQLSLGIVIYNCKTFKVHATEENT
jgi:hypothetical protein